MTNIETDNLRSARNIIANGWCQGTYARNALNEPTFGYDPNATSFCAVGALKHVVEEKNMPYKMASYHLLKALYRLSENHVTLSDYNDDPKTTKEMILELYDKAIELSLFDED